MLSREDFRSALEAARDEWHCKNHPFFTSWAAGTLSKDAMKAYCQQHYNFVSNASRYAGIMYGMCDWWDARQLFLENLNEEEDPRERHVDKLARFGKALGMDLDESRGSPDLPTTAALKDYILNTILLRGTLHGTALLIIGLESQVPDLYRPIVPALRHVYGFAEEDIEFFVLHIEADVEHGDHGFQIVLDHTHDEQTQLDLVETVRQTAMKRWFYMDGLWLQHVEGREWFPARVEADG
jgi:pyrroloquinoline-quinone synthase